MSDAAVRAAERAYRASGSPADGDAWVQAVLRSTGLNSTFLIARVIEIQRALRAQGQYRLEGPTRDEVRAALERPVTPDDMVSFLRGGSEWLEAPSIVLGRQGTDFLAVERPALHPHQVGRNPTGAYDAAPTRGVPAGSAILCNHANENPGHCPCDPDCYCRQDGHTCSERQRARWRAQR